ncbi:GNAT family N-acetyltransferase [Marinactinospora thermotolerans]|uniref:GNAT family N-acetyltransferase n=1 Tax=Marinactinospora thermotolerans TaxID=531310 RepID=UPI003D92BFD7
MATLLRTPRRTLRAFTENDVDSLVALDGDPEVMRFVNGGRPTSRSAVCEEVLPRLLRRHPRTGLPGYGAAEDRRTGAFLGWFEFHPLDDADPTVVELGYRLRRSAWGRGLATEGARSPVRAGFTDLRVRGVTASTMVVNTRSRRVLEKTGLRQVRVVFEDWPDPIDGAEHGDVEYALTRSEWEESSGPAGRG